MMTPLVRRPDESDKHWLRRVRRDIIKQAPNSQRIFIRGGKPGARNQRWILAAIFIVPWLLILTIAYRFDADVRDLNGPNGRQGDFLVESLVDSGRSSAKRPQLQPVITVRNERIVPLFSLSHKRVYGVGDTVTVRYSVDGPVKAAVLDDNGTVTNPASQVAVSFGIISIAIGLGIGFFYRGKVDPRYIEIELEKRRQASDGMSIR